MSITLELPADLEAALRADAEAQGLSIEEVAALQLAAIYGNQEETLEAIGRGLADVEAGRTFSLEEVRAHTEAALGETSYASEPESTKKTY